MPAVPPVIDMTWLGYVLMLVVVYYTALYILRRARPALPPSGSENYQPMMVLVVPAHNEEDVLAQTLTALNNLDYPNRLVLVMNDGSKDRTSEIAHTFEMANGTVQVVDRGPDVAGQGKGAVLNHAFELLCGMAEAGDPLLRGFNADRVVVGIMDADGQLERHALGEVAPYFAESDVAGVQIGVRIANARSGLLARMQDIEFIGFSGYVQEARDTFGSVGLGGNGQFTRLSALQALGREPWTDCLTEDLDLSLSLVQDGWRIRFCPTAFVAQQGLTKVRPMLRQRTRWVQGHYQCWQHLPSLLRNKKVPVRTRLDLTVYLVMITFTMIVFAGMVASLGQLTGLYVLRNDSLGWLPYGPVRNCVAFALSFGPPLLFLATYQRKATHRLAAYEIPTYLIAFSFFGFHWIVSQLWAWTRMATRQGSWAKTPRVAAEAAV